MNLRNFKCRPPTLLMEITKAISNNMSFQVVFQVALSLRFHSLNIIHLLSTIPF